MNGRQLRGVKGYEVNVMDYTVIIHKAEEGGYWVEVPALPGCFSQGETIEEALQNVQEAVALHLEGLAEEGQEAPRDEGWFITRVPAAIEAE